MNCVVCKVDNSEEKYHVIGAISGDCGAGI